MQRGRITWVAGATGLVGTEVLAQLLAEPHAGQVVAIVRRPLATHHPNLVVRVLNFRRAALETELAGETADVGICCLGTTLKQAGSREQFRRVDYDYVVGFARAALAAGVRHFLVVTAVGANAHSRIFYNRIKGEVEEALRGMAFDQLTIVRPSLLLGRRQGIRLGEKLAGPISRLLPARYRGIQAQTVARALIRLADADPARSSSPQVVESDTLRRVGSPSNTNG